jgi:hypothetical protein
MNKTLHKKLTDKHILAQTSAFTRSSEDMLVIARQELSILRDAAKDLLQPRQEAIDYILKMSRDM